MSLSSSADLNYMSSKVRIFNIYSPKILGEWKNYIAVEFVLLWEADPKVLIRVQEMPFHRQKQPERNYHWVRKTWIFHSPEHSFLLAPIKPRVNQKYYKALEKMYRYFGFLMYIDFYSLCRLSSFNYPHQKWIRE